jgi:hypothetical protein
MLAAMDALTTSVTPGTALRLAARILLLGERLDTAGLERSDVISTAPLAFRVGDAGYAVLFRYGAAVLIGLTPVAEDEVVRGLRPRISGPFPGRRRQSRSPPTATTRSPPAGRSRCATSTPRGCW